MLLKLLRGVVRCLGPKGGIRAVALLSTAAGILLAAYAISNRQDPYFLETTYCQQNRFEKERRNTEDVLEPGNNSTCGSDIVLHYTSEDLGSTLRRLQELEATTSVLMVVAGAPVGFCCYNPTLVCLWLLSGGLWVVSLSASAITLATFGFRYYVMVLGVVALIALLFLLCAAWCLKKTLDQERQSTKGTATPMQDLEEEKEAEQSAELRPGEASSAV